jgi:hypothetical protein
MENTTERNWRANVVIASAHAGLKPEFKRLEDEIYRVLARVDDPRDVREYIKALLGASQEFMKARVSDWPEK